MIIYGALLIPLITAFILYKYYSRQTTWWEFCIPFCASLIFTVSMKAIIETVQVSCKEYYGSFIKTAEYYEPWNEYIHRICTISCGKNCTTTYDCSYVQYHSAYWQITTTTDEEVIINESEYERIKSFFGNDHFLELNRNYYTQDGNCYYSSWPSDSLHAIPVTTRHKYENRIKAADQSVFHFEHVTENDVTKYNLKEYPDITEYYKQDAVIGDNSEEAAEANKKIKYINGLLGPTKEVKVFVLIFKNQPVQAAFFQEWYWSGANMNEFVVCIGIDNDRNVQWCKPISWTRSEILKSKVKDFVQSQKRLDLCDLSCYMQQNINELFVRRNFKEFDYLTVEPPMWAVILTYLLTIAINFGISYWVVRNDY